ncbi:Tn3 family transposase [Legionella lytica]|uniref:Tn3 family transposase n=1 Tax=Legionella lytica TaxID=96232 RepID=A0ABW8DBS0_9GAMM
MVHRLLHETSTINLGQAIQMCCVFLSKNDDIISYGQKIYLKLNEISERILLSIYGMGTNVGLKHMCAGNAHVSEYQLRHIKNYFLSTDNFKKRTKQSGKYFIQNQVKRNMGRDA